MSVVVAYAESSESSTALTYGVQEAARRGSPLLVLATSQEAERSANARLTEVGGSLPAWSVRTAPHQQQQSHAVLDLAAEVDAELIVVGTRRRSPVGKLLLGSLVQDILLAAESPVVVVKP